MIKLLYKPVSMLVSVLGGILAGAVFKQVWKVVGREDDAPKATDARRGWREVLLAATLQGAIFALVKAAVDRGAAEGTRKLTGVWPGGEGQARGKSTTMTGPDPRSGASDSHRREVTETIPPQNEVSGGPGHTAGIGLGRRLGGHVRARARAGHRLRSAGRPQVRGQAAVLVGGEINAESEREAAAQAGHPQAQASAEAVHKAA